MALEKIGKNAYCRQKNNDEIGHLRTGKKYPGPINPVSCFISRIWRTQHEYILNDNAINWRQWNCGVRNVFFLYTGSLDICGHNYEQHRLLLHVVNHMHSFMSINRLWIQFIYEYNWPYGQFQQRDAPYYPAWSVLN